MEGKLQEKLLELPDNPGIYLFYDKAGVLVYVGKATSLRSRVSSYWRGARTTRPIESMIHEVVDLKTISTDSVLEAIVLEGKYIKDFRPKYNVDWKDDKSWNYLVITKEQFPHLLTERSHELDVLSESEKKAKYLDIFGPYPGLNTRTILKLLQKLFYISTCSSDAKRPCLYYQMGQCLGVCAGEISASEYLKKVIRPLRSFLGGHKKAVIAEFEKTMTKESVNQNFEEAGRLRDQINALSRIQDIALMNRSFEETATDGFKISRVEGYDISNLGESNKVASMVVFNNREPVKSQYRKFKIRSVVGQSDVDCLKEVIMRRLNHSEWPMPNIWLIDGGLPQVHAVASVFKAKNLVAPIVGIAKGAERKRNDFILIGGDDKIKEWVFKNKKLLIQARDEAHRFAIQYQRKLRKI